MSQDIPINYETRKPTDRVSLFDTHQCPQHFVADWGDEMWIEHGYNSPTGMLVAEGINSRRNVVITNIDDEPPTEYKGPGVDDRR